MNLTEIFGSDLFKWVILPVLIFLARIIDMTLDTIRIVMISRGKRLLAPLFGFFEVLIWLMAIGQIMQNLSNVFCYLAYASGFAMGNFVGLTIEGKIAMGIVLVRVITSQNASDLAEKLRGSGFGVTILDAQGTSGKVNIIFVVIKRAFLKRVVEIIQECNPKAFYTVEDVRHISEGVFPARRRPLRKYESLLRIFQKEK
jgi:uncharacterized protein YebE (UPF0316 family)